MSQKRTIKIHRSKHDYSRAEILESLAYEIKPFIFAASGFASAAYFSSAGGPGAGLAKFCSLTIMACGLFILYWRAKDRGVIQ